jgi:Mlc titration factor MtfA (ptsG expression regulator)
MWFEVLVAFFMCVFAYYIIASVIALLNERKDKAHYQQQLQEALPDYLVYSGSALALTKNTVAEILKKHFPYYAALHPSLQQKFLKRVSEFIRSKTFIIRHNEGFKEMPVLISAAAIQITFGLKRYLLPYFSYIQIYPEEYFAENALRVLAGHVKDNTISIAWNHFLKGFQEDDGVNVGLHEMAHALYYQHLIADVYKHKPFVANFEEVMQQGEATFKECRHRSDRLFSDYAFTNMQEFWAESLEWFFERPADMQRLYASLFQELCDLLKQNPSKRENPLL